MAATGTREYSAYYQWSMKPHNSITLVMIPVSVATGLVADKQVNFDGG